MSFMVSRSDTGDLSPHLCCTKCGQPCRPDQAWLVFPALTDAANQQPAEVVHKTCIERQALGRRRSVQWRATEVLSLLIQQMRDDPLQRLARATGGYYREPSSGQTHAQPKISRHPEAAD